MSNRFLKFAVFNGIAALLVFLGHLGHAWAQVSVSTLTVIMALADSILALAMLDSRFRDNYAETVRRRELPIHGFSLRSWMWIHIATDVAFFYAYAAMGWLWTMIASIVALVSNASIWSRALTEDDAHAR